MPNADPTRRAPAPHSTKASQAKSSSSLAPAAGNTETHPAGEGKANESLVLSPAMRTTFASAVRNLLLDSRLAGRSEPVKLTAVVVLAKAPAFSAVVDMPYRDVAGWLGCSVSHVGHTVVPDVKSSGAVLCARKRSDEGQTESLRLELLPLREARAAADGNPLALLSKRELATLLRFCEAVFCPGWAPKDKVATPAGFMASRRGRGAATDRLAMVLLCLEARTDGRVRMAPGRLPEGCRRADATLARLMGCPLEVAASAVDRLVAAGDLELEGEERPGGGRLRVPAVADAHRRVRKTWAPKSVDPPSPLVDESLQESGPCARCAGTESSGEGLVLAGEGWAQESLEDLLLAAADGASGDQIAEDSVNCQVNAGSEGPSDEPACADLHAPHAVMVALSRSSDGDMGCFSGSAVLGDDPLRECARAGEDLRDQDPPAETSRQSRSGRDPLRGEKQICSSGSGSAKFVKAGVVPSDLAMALDPVAHLWTGITRISTAKWLAKEVRAEISRLQGKVGPERAESVLAARLQRRLNAQGSSTVTQVVGWLLRRGLPQRPDCWSQLCDDGIRMDTGISCESCSCRVGDRQALRRSVAATVSGEFLTASPDVLRAEVERRLQDAVREQAANEALRRERMAQEQVLRLAAVEQRRQELAAQEIARVTAACRTCGVPDTAGECPLCTFQRSAADLVSQAVDIVVALRVDVLDLQAVGELTQQVEQDTWAVIKRSESSAAADDPGARAHGRYQVARRLLEERRRRALERLAHSEPADAEAEHVFRMAMLRAHAYASRAERAQAARQAGEKARRRVAQDLLAEFLADLGRVRANLAGPSPVRMPWSERCAEMIGSGV